MWFEKGFLGDDARAPVDAVKEAMAGAEFTALYHGEGGINGAGNC